MKRLEHVEISKDSRVPKYKQIVDSIAKNINKGNLLMGERLPSINEFSQECILSRDTVEKAYNILKEKKIIVSVKGKGFYVAKTNLSTKLNVLFLINKASTYKMRIFNSFSHFLGAVANIDLHVYHCIPSIFNSIIEHRLNQYDYYIVMPHFKDEEHQHMGCTDEILDAIHSIPNEKLIIMDRNLKSLSKKAGRVYQDFTKDIFTALNSASEKIKCYKKIILVYPNKAVYPYPKGIVEGFKRFCLQFDLDYEVLDEIYDNMELQLKDLYIVIEELDLVNLVKQSRDRYYKLGKDIGIISYNDTPLKELLGITVISTDFKKMGEEAAKMILNGNKVSIKNDFNFIDRNSI